MVDGVDEFFECWYMRSCKRDSISSSSPLFLRLHDSLMAVKKCYQEPSSIQNDGCSRVTRRGAGLLVYILLWSWHL